MTADIDILLCSRRGGMKWDSMVRRRGLLAAGALGASAMFFEDRVAGADRPHERPAGRADIVDNTAGISSGQAQRPIVEALSYPEHRTAAQLAADGPYAYRQVEALSTAQARQRVDRLIDVIRARQNAALDHLGVPFDRYRPAGSGTEVLVARGELIVRMDLPRATQASDGTSPDTDALSEAVTARMNALGYARVADRSPELTASAQTRPSPPPTAVFRSHKTPNETARDLLALRAAGVVAAMNVVVPLGHTIKGDDYPVITQRIPPRPGATPAAVRVAVIDTGIAAEPRGDGWLNGVMAETDNIDPLDVLPTNGRLDWGSGHGTFTAGIVQQMAPRCEIVAYRFTRSDGLGTEKDVADTLVRAARDAHAAGVPTIINASLGTPAIDGVPPMAMRDAVEFIAASYPEVLIIASAGNLGSTEPIYPAAFDGVVAVGALTDDLRPATFSSHGSWVRCSTVGIGIVSTFVRGVVPPEPDPLVPDQNFGYDACAMWSGTSFSAPQISGAIARLCYDNPGLTPHSALDALLTGQPELPGYGRILRLLPGTPTP
ncbi:MAG TPA: S8/S53 family peptidase [Candidatus Limnocylindrales bacterium]|nr:S8/S53 family peptidase [Candidatus Limnocylindrales bacterium]